MRILVIEDEKRLASTIADVIENENNIVQISIEKLIDYRKQQPFSMYSDEKKQEVKESIEKFGVLNPIIVRPIENEQYEIISGHNRVEISKELDQIKYIESLINYSLSLYFNNEIHASYSILKKAW